MNIYRGSYVLQSFDILLLTEVVITTIAVTNFRYTLANAYVVQCSHRIS